MLGEKSLGMHQQFFPRRRHPDPGTGAMQKQLAELIFKPMHLHAERGLGAPDLLGGKADGPRLRHNNEILQQSDIERLHDINLIDSRIK